MRLLCAVGSQCIRAESELSETVLAILDAALALTGSDKGYLQVADPSCGVMRIACQRGFDAPLLSHLESTGATSGGKIPPSLGPTVIGDVEGGEVTSTPLGGSDGRLVGAIAVHFPSSHRPSERDLGLMDLLARLAADYLERKRQDGLLERMTADLRQVLDSTGTGLARCDRDCRHLEANGAYVRMAGRPADEILGRPIVEVTGEDAFAVIRPYVERVLRGEQVEYEAELPFASGAPIWARVVYTPTRNADGDVVGWLASISDITERRDAERLNAEQRRLLEAIASEARLDSCLALLTEAIPRLYPGVRAAVVLADASRRRIERRLAPGLPPPFCESVKGLAIDHQLIGTCGAAIFQGVPIECPDIARDDTWSPEWRTLCLAAGVRAIRSTPILRPDGAPCGAFTLCFAETHPTAPRDVRIAEFGTHIAAMAVARDAAKRRLRRSEEQLRLAIEAAGVGLWNMDPRTQRLHVPVGVDQMLGLAAGTRLSMAEFYAGVHPEDREAIRDAFAAALDPERRAVYDVEFRIRAGENGVERWIGAKGRGLFDNSGTCVRVIGAAIDITERRRHEERQKLLLNELNHRVKNTLAAVQSLARQTLRNADSLAEGRAGLEARLIALSRAHDVLTQNRWESADLHELAAGALSAYDTARGLSRIEIDGPAVRLAPKAALALSLALHELATNAVKYGALSIETGRVRLDWTLSPASARGFRLRWTERGGPPVAQPRRSGFGSRLIEQGLAADIDAQVRLTFASEGVTCMLEAPAEEICPRR